MRAIFQGTRHVILGVDQLYDDVWAMSFAGALF